ncbi:MAG: DUF3987 domain-containing protein [Pleurocapsa minor GSE-CHR-MK-17-07R]|jgi:hypothetical protein|nr:DUF3987 domain-containing protein [Pleurocapsa minor GSE-CHR-MK 17-07R]
MMNLTEHGAYALRRAVSMLDIPAELTLSPLVESLLASLDWRHDRAHWSILQQILTHDPNLSAQVLRVDPTATVPTSSKTAEDAYVPPLAKAAHLTDKLLSSAETVGAFQRDCLSWLSQRSPMTPRIFLESGPLWAVGLAVARRCVLRLGFGDIYPNLYYLWVAPTTYYHKSTGLNAITDMVRDTMPHLLLPATTSPEMLVAKLAGEKPANYDKLLPFERRNEDLAARFAGQRGILIDEASKMLIPKKYMEGHTETMMEMFDAPRRLERELRGDGTLIVYNPALAMIGATTPARLGRYITDSEWEDGLMARFLCLTPTEREIKCVLNGHNLDTHEFPADLKTRLLRVYNAFPMPLDEAALHDLDEPVKHPAISAKMDPAVFDLFNAYYAALHDMTDPRRNLDDRLRGNYGRFSTMALKLALILAIIDWVDAGTQNAPRITTAHWARGQMLAEEYRASVHRLLDELSIGVDVKNEKKVLDFIARHGERPPSARDVLRGAGVKSRKEVDATLSALIEDGVIEIAERKTGGRSARGYRVTHSELSSEA